MKAWKVIEGLAKVAAVLGYLSAMVVTAYFLTARLFSHLGFAPPGYLVQVINALLGFVLFILSIGIVTTIGGRNERLGQNALFNAFVEALEQIAQGNFDVRLERKLTRHEERHFGELVNSVNNVARQLGQIETMRQEFISDVSHEIQSPLTSIRGFARALHKDALTDEERHHYLDIIETESTRLSRITEHLLKLAALEAEQVPFDPKPFRLDRQLRELILACEPQWTEKRLDMGVHLEEVHLSADADLLSQVWINLLHNAIKFTPEDGQVRVALRQHGHEVEVAVADTGIGIAEEDLPRIFERFYKADRSRTRSSEGSGFGLAIAKKIVELHHGAIKVESVPGAGATFIIRLPVGVGEPVLNR